MAYSNLKKICDEHLSGRYTIEVIDIQEKPHIAKADQIVAVPTVVRKLPLPIRTTIGVMSDARRTLIALDLPLAS
jgi:circadian clock protein KaiB